MTTSRRPHVVVIGAGFAGLSAAWELVQRGLRVTVCEADEEVGGLAGSFPVGDTRLEKFYHHWFTSDTHVLDLVRELGREDQVLHRATRTGMYFAHRLFQAEHPLRYAAIYPALALDGCGSGCSRSGPVKYVTGRRWKSSPPKSGWSGWAGAKSTTSSGARYSRGSSARMPPNLRSVVLEQAEAAGREPGTRRRRSAGLLPGRIRGAGRSAGPR